MNSHALTSDIPALGTVSDERRLLARGLVGRVEVQHHKPYRFEIGQQVMWGDEPWTVAGRETSAMGRRFYVVTREVDVRPVRTVIEVVLAPIA